MATKQKNEIKSWVSLTEAAKMADVSQFWMRTLVQQGKVEGVRIGNNYIVKKDSAERFERHPSAGRPRN